MDELKKVFLELGYNEEEFNKIINTYQLTQMKPKTLIIKVKDNFNYLLLLGYSKEEIKKITKRLPTIYSYSVENIQRKIEDMQKLGYSKEEVIKMTKSFPAIYSSSIENIRQKIEDIQKLGYSKEEIIKMTKKFPAIYGFNIENIRQKIEDIQKLGYSKEEIIKMTKSLPSIYGFNIENIRQKIEDIQKLGYSKEEIIKMTKSLPSIYSFNIDSIQQKIEFYDSIGLHFLAVLDSKQLMQSTKLSYARYMFYKEKGININEENYRKLFVGQKAFEKQYGLTKEEILEKYPYPFEEEKNNKKVNRTIKPVQAVKSLISQDGVLEEVLIAEKIENNEKDSIEQTEKGD